MHCLGLEHAGETALHAWVNTEVSKVPSDESSFETRPEAFEGIHSVRTDVLGSGSEVLES